MPGELVSSGWRSRVVAAFDPPGATAAFERWQADHAAALAAVPPEAMRVEYGRRGAGLYVRVRIEETQIPPELQPDPPPAAA
ncbi:MAG TPA: hypothetical protein VHK22_03510 [Gaiellaceae bacterium]|nr:hypothetical protein [Gaiellaceae bacterium]